ncbi:MAG TPA: 3,4-dihydroxy-2-butanone-4-phosphate synthase, partial [Gemmataceae bacterium]|nr:3,4-dihydroxy-2-butanone-4-phosphate synthase [Gemmataceae bacterium]
MSTTQEGFCSIEESLEELRQGRMIVLVDDEYRENEGDLVIAAEKVTPEAINFMVRNGCGILGLSMSADICDRLDLEPLPGRNVDAQATPWTPHIDARTGITTGTSAFDRARTIQVVIDERSTVADLVVGKGHVPGLRARKGGVLVR